MSRFDEVRGELMQLVDRGRDVVRTGSLSARQAIERVLLPLVPSAMAVVQPLAVSGAEKKEAVLVFVDEFYLRVIEPIDLPGPDRLLDPVFRQLARASTSLLIDVFASFVKSAAAPSVLESFQPKPPPPPPDFPEIHQ